MPSSGGRSPWALARSADAGLEAFDVGPEAGQVSLRIIVEEVLQLQSIHHGQGLSGDRLGVDIVTNQPLRTGVLEGLDNLVRQ